MKKNILTLSIIMVLICMILSVPIYAEENGVTVVYGTPTVDAVIDDVWESVPGYKTLNSYGGAPVTSDTLSEWKFMWDEERFYVLIVVTDSQLNAQNATYWQNDCTQLFIDFEHSSDFGNYSYENFGAAIGIRNCWEGGILTPPESFVIEALGQNYIFEEGEDEYDQVEKAQKTVDNGYIIEYSFKPTLYWSDFKMESGQQGGIDFCNDDSLEGSDKRDNLFTFSKNGDTWGNPKNLITFTLADKDSVVDLEAIKAAQEAAAAEAAALAAAKQTLIDSQIAAGVDVVYGTPVIDGDIDDVWANVPGYKAEYIYNDEEAKSVCYPTFKFMWDEDFFYVLGEIKDNQLNAMTHTLWANDNLQFFIDFGHEHDFAANEYNGDGSSIGIRYCWLGGVVELPEGFTVEALGGGSYSSDDEKYTHIVKAQKTTDDGWILEFAFNPTLFAPEFKMIEGAKGGLDYVIDDTNIGNDTGSRDTLYVFSIQSNTWSSSKNLIPFTFIKNDTTEATVEPEVPTEAVISTETPVFNEPEPDTAETEISNETPGSADTIPETVEKTAPVAESDVKAPQTFDFGLASAAAALISLAGFAFSRKYSRN